MIKRKKGQVEWVWWVRVGDGSVVSRSVDSGCHNLSENIWFVWSKTCYKGEKLRCHACDTRTDGHWKVEQYSAEGKVNKKKRKKLIKICFALPLTYVH